MSAVLGTNNTRRKARRWLRLVYLTLRLRSISAARWVLDYELYESEFR